MHMTGEKENRMSSVSGKKRTTMVKIEKRNVVGIVQVINWKSVLGLLLVLWIAFVESLNCDWGRFLKLQTTMIICV